MEPTNTISKNQLFLVHLNNFHATQLFFHMGENSADWMFLKIDFADHAFHTGELVVEQQDGEAFWGFEKKFAFEVKSQENHFHLQQRTMTITCCQYSKHHHVEYGTAVVDLFTIATGPTHHNLPLQRTTESGTTTEVGRISFDVDMEQFSQIEATFQVIKVFNLEPLPGHTHVHPFLQYGHSTSWYHFGMCLKSEVFDLCENPQWWNLPQLRFRTSFKRLIHESIDIEVCHHGSFFSYDDIYGCANLVFKAKPDNLTLPDHVFQFSGSLRYREASIEGKVTLANLPTYAQMVDSNQVSQAVHTEKGIFNGKPLLKNLPLPKVPIFWSEDPIAVAHSTSSSTTKDNVEESSKDNNENASTSTAPSKIPSGQHDTPRSHAPPAPEPLTHELYTLVYEHDLDQINTPIKRDHKALHTDSNVHSSSSMNDHKDGNNNSTEGISNNDNNQSEAHPTPKHSSHSFKLWKKSSSSNYMHL